MRRGRLGCGRFDRDRPVRSWPVQGCPVCGWLLLGAGLFLAGSGWGCCRLDHHGARRRRHHNYRRPGHHGARGRPGHYRSNGRAGGNGRRRGRSHNDGRRRTRLGHNPARSRRRWRGSHNRRRRRGLNGGCHDRLLRPLRQASLPRLGFFFLLFGQNGLHHVAGLGDVGEIDLGLDALRGARGLGAQVAAGLRGALELRADLVRLVVLNRTRVGLAAGQAELCQCIKNLPTLDFHLACQIVDSNLTHPPLFSVCCPRRLVAHGYLMAMDCDRTLIIARTG